MSEDYKQIGMIKPIHEYIIIDKTDASGNTSDVNIDYHITWRITDKCNMACEYCRWFDGDNYEQSRETLNNLFVFFKKSNFKNVLFYFHGGEPGLHPDVIKILSHMRTLEEDYGIKIFIEFQTNLSYTWKRLKQIIEFIDGLSISYHFVDLVKSKNEILLTNFHNNMNELIKMDYPIEHFDVMLENVQPEERLQEFYNNVLEFLKYDKIKHSEMIHSFCHYEKNEKTKKQHVEFYNKHNMTEQQYRIDGKIYNTNDLFEKGVDCRGAKCNAGKTNIVVNADGNVFHCGIEMTYYRLKCEPVTPITNVVTDPMWMTKLAIKRKTGTICKWDYCGGDFYIPKEP